MAEAITAVSVETAITAGMQDITAVQPGRTASREEILDHVDTIDYKNVAALRRFVSERGKILPRRVTGTCAKHQRKINLAIKRARAIALLPFSAD